MLLFDVVLEAPAWLPRFKVLPTHGYWLTKVCSIQRGHTLNTMIFVHGNWPKMAKLRAKLRPRENFLEFAPFLFWLSRVLTFCQKSKPLSYAYERRI